MLGSLAVTRPHIGDIISYQERLHFCQAPSDLVLGDNEFISLLAVNFLNDVDWS